MRTTLLQILASAALASAALSATALVSAQAATAAAAAPAARPVLTAAAPAAASWPWREAAIVCGGNGCNPVHTHAIDRKRKFKTLGHG